MIQDLSNWQPAEPMIQRRSGGRDRYKVAVLTGRNMAHPTSSARDKDALLRVALVCFAVLSGRLRTCPACRVLQDAAAPHHQIYRPDPRLQSLGRQGRQRRQRYSEFAVIAARRQKCRASNKDLHRPSRAGQHQR